MKYCKNCSLSYHTPLKTCLFCNNELTTNNNLPESYAFPPFIKEPPVRKMTMKIIFFLNFVVNVICFYIDFMTGKDSIFSWSLYVLGATIYTYLFLHLMTKKASAIYKVFLLFIITILELLSIGMISGTYHWATDLILPFGIITLNITMTSFLFGRRTKLYDNTIYVLLSCIFSFVPLLLLLLNITNTSWPSITCIIYSVIIFFTLCYFRSQELKNELYRRLHF